MGQWSGGLQQGGQVPFALRRDVERHERDAYLSASRIRSLQFVTQAGMLAASGLASFEARLASDVPAAAGRLSAINDVAMGAIAAEIRGVTR
jgi:hypothetical protein